MTGLIRRRPSMRIRCLNTNAAAAALLLALISTASASAGVAIDFVTVGDAGNAPDPGGYGAVPYEYRMGQYEVTVSQYTAFLNAVAAADSYGLYTPAMAGDWCGITRTGTDGHYVYEAQADLRNKPVTHAGILNAARFANWLHNGQPTGPQAAGTTEDGAYMLNGATNPDATLISRNTGAEVFLPSEDEWCKAAYYKAGALDAGYWLYATGSDTAPTGEIPPGGTNSANYDQFNNLEFVTDVGEYHLSISPYGTFDQNGNLAEYNESWVRGAQGYSYGIRGGSFKDDSPLRLSGAYRDYAEGAGSDHRGFRVAAIIPEPSAISLLLAAVLMSRPRRSN